MAFKQDPTNVRAIVYGALLEDITNIEEAAPYVLLGGKQVLTPGLQSQAPDDLSAQFPDDELISSALEQANVPVDVTEVVREAFSSAREAPAQEQLARLTDALLQSDLPVEQSDHGDLFLKTDEGTGVVLYHQGRHQEPAQQPGDEVARSLTHEFRCSLEDAVQSGQRVVIDEGRLSFLKEQVFVDRLKKAQAIAHGPETLAAKQREVASLIGLSETSAGTLLEQL